MQGSRWSQEINGGPTGQGLDQTWIPGGEGWWQPEGSQPQPLGARATESLVLMAFNVRVSEWDSGDHCGRHLQTRGRGCLLANTEEGGLRPRLVLVLHLQEDIQHRAQRGPAVPSPINTRSGI